MVAALVLAALAAAGAGAVPAALARSPDAPASPAAVPKVRQMVVFRDGHALAKRVSTAATSIRVAGRRCAVGERTPLAALVRSRPGRLRFRDFGACSSRARDSAGILVTGIGPDRNRGQRGWVYKVGRRAADCQRTLERTATPVTGGIVATVRGYDDAGDGVPIEGARVTSGSITGITGPDGDVQMALSSGTHRLVARKDGLVRSFTERVEVP
jgi:hypothetical protein